MSNLELTLIKELAEAKKTLLGIREELQLLKILCEVRECEVCGSPFAAMKNRGAMYCSDKCKVKAHEQRKKSASNVTPINRKAK